MFLLSLVPYLAAVVFIAAVVARWVKLSRMPPHLRWELYPVAHEANRHGGSFFEHLDWWTRRQKPNRMGTVKAMVPEMVLLTGVRRHNLALWRRSFPFHAGLYLLAGWLGLLLGGAIAQAAGARITSDAAGLAALLAHATVAAGVAGFVLLVAGAAGLLVRRLSDPALRTHSAPADYANLALFIFMGLLGLGAFALVDRDFSILREVVCGLVTFTPATEVPALVALEVVAGSLLVAYIPLTHMSHFVGKWFMYHDVRWNDEVNRVGSKLEAAIGAQLGRKVSWSASHIAGGGKKTWADVATEEVGKP